MSLRSESLLRLSTRPERKSVRFKCEYNLRNLLLGVVNENDKHLYDALVEKIRNVGQGMHDEDLAQLLKEARSCISILDGNFRLFVQVVLILRWTHRSEEVAKEFEGFLLDLCSAHNYYTKLVIDHLVQSFKLDSAEWKDGCPTEESMRNFSRLHSVIRTILIDIPMSRKLLIASVQSNYPFIKKPPKEHEAFVYNVLLICQHSPSLREELLKILVTKLVALDAQAPRTELEKCEMDMEVDDGVFEMEPVNKKSLGPALDASLVVLFNYIQSEIHSNGAFDSVKFKETYNDLLQIFMEVVLPTHSIHHVQFIMFYLLSFKPSAAMTFVRTVWSWATTPSNPPVIRQSAVCYIGSILARAKYIAISSVHDVLNDMATWIHGYIGNHDESGVMVSPDLRAHNVFYAVCQSLFYLIAFRFKELTLNKGLVLLQNLNLSKIVTSRLNPLKFCSSVVVSNFASVARNYQLAYCYTIIERNSRNTLPQIHRDSYGMTAVSNTCLDSFFPFDPYLLVRSRRFIEPHYREYQSDSDSKRTNEQSNDEDDDFLESMSPATGSERRDIDFSYSSSPGFLHVSN